MKKDSNLNSAVKPNIGTALAIRAYETDYLSSILDDIETVVRENFIYPAPTNLVLSDEIVSAALRFADILSHSDESTHRNTAYRILALLHELRGAALLSNDHTDALTGVTEAVLIEIGNFPAIRTLRRVTDKELVASPSKEATRALKFHTNQTKRGELVYTDAQFRVVEGLKRSNFFSFSGPTSLGKSFILKDRIFDLISQAATEDKAVVVLVPTRALISQTIVDLEEVLEGVDNVHLSQHPNLPPYLRRKFSRTVFVFTPERLLSYVSNYSRPIVQLFVDEAQKVIADNDARSPLYYHAINETLRTFATGVAFASPNISNPEIFLQLFQRSTEGHISVPERTVAQQKYFVDLHERRIDYYRYAPNGSVVSMEVPVAWKSKFDVVRSLSRSSQSIVYINSAAGVVNDAILFSKDLEPVQDERIEELVQFAANHVHEQYFFIKCLKKGVAFHHGRMPQELRERIEHLYSSPDSPLKYVFCTSTLLEGVNLPAKNIFVLSDKHGLRDLTSMDFENLIGRAGRLTYDFSGNVVCVREVESSWKGKTRRLIEGTDALEAESFLVNTSSRRKKELLDIQKVLTRRPLPKDRSAESIRISRQYASILTLHEIDGQSSGIKDLFLKRIDNGQEQLRKVATELTVPVRVLRRTPDIAAHYQEDLWRKLKSSKDYLPLITSEDDLTQNATYLRVLDRLYSQYNWGVEESIGTYKLVPSRASARVSMDSTKARLRYWANLMRNWVAGKPLNLIIRSSILYFKDEGVITIRDYSSTSTYRTVPFVETDPVLINRVIEDLLLDIEVGMRFRIMRYLQNFHDIAVQAQGTHAAGPDLASLIEYGTQDPAAIALQDVGLSRNASIKIATKYRGAIEFSVLGELVDFQIDTVLRELQDDNELASEINRTFRKSRKQTGAVRQSQ